MTPSPEYVCRLVAPDEHRDRAAVFWALCDAGLDRIVFYDRDQAHINDFLFVAGPENAWLARVEDAQGRLAGAAWINGFTGRVGFAHFAAFDPPHALAIGRTFLDFMARTRALDALMGLTPQPYGHALRFIRRLGFRILAAVPGACFMHRRACCVPGVVSMYVFEDPQKDRTHEQAL